MVVMKILLCQFCYLYLNYNSKLITVYFTENSNQLIQKYCVEILPAYK